MQINREVSVQPTATQQLTADTLGRGEWWQTALDTHGVILQRTNPRVGCYVEVRHYRWDERPRVELSIKVVDVPHEQLTALVERFEAEATRIANELGA